MQKYMNAVYKEVCQNGGRKDLSNIHTKRPFLPEGKMKLKDMFEQHGKSHFTLEIDGFKCHIRAIPDRDEVDGPTISMPGEVSEPTTSSIGKTFKVDSKTKCYYVTEPSKLESATERLFAEIENDINAPGFVSIGCEGAPNSLELIQIATSDSVYIFDCQRIGAKQVCNGLEQLLRRESPIKLIHDLHKDAIALEKFGETELVGALDTQLLEEFLRKKPFTGFNAFLSHLDLPIHPSNGFVDGRTKSGVDLWSKRPIAQKSLACAAMDVSFLQNAAERIPGLVKSDVLQQLLDASSARAKHSIEHSGFRSICFDKKRNFVVASTELMKATRPHDGFWGEKLKVKSDVNEIFDTLPSIYKTKFAEPKDEPSIMGLVNSYGAASKIKKDGMIPLEWLSDIVLDIGRRAHCWIRDSRVFLCDDEDKLVTQEEIDELSANLGTFGSDNRAGLDVGTFQKVGSLHRFSAIRDRDNQIMGITIRVGRNVGGNAAMLMDLLMNTDKSILILGEPGSGKTTIVREATRKLAEDKNVIVIDTSNEIAGDGTSPHSCIGLARRMMVPSLNKQSDVMIECVQNHTPHIMVIDEIGRPKEVQAASTVKQRGVRMIASAHGDLRRLLKNKDLNSLVGGLESVTLGDDMAKEEGKRRQKIALVEDGEHRSLEVSKTQTKRRSDSTFEIIVEVTRESRHEWRIIADSARAVDKILDGLRYHAQLRKRDPETGYMWMDFVDA